jgi:hypothetical protein
MKRITEKECAENKGAKTMTNFERIRNMSLEEFAETQIVEHWNDETNETHYADVIDGGGFHGGSDTFEEELERLIKWLNSESKTK